MHRISKFIRILFIRDCIRIRIWLSAHLIRHRHRMLANCSSVQLFVQCFAFFNCVFRHGLFFDTLYTYIIVLRVCLPWRSSIYNWNVLISTVFCVFIPCTFIYIWLTTETKKWNNKVLYLIYSRNMISRLFISKKELINIIACKV